MVTLNSAFDKLSEEKKQQIIDVCLEEFGNKGFKGGSTDVITDRLNISKGILYYYFGNKKNLFLYILNYAMNKVTNKMIEDMKTVRANSFSDRVKEVLLRKLRSTLEYPKETQFLIKAYSDIPPNMKTELMTLKQSQVEMFNRLRHEYLFKYIDTSNLREGIPLIRVIEFSNIVFDYITQKCLMQYKGREYELLQNPNVFLAEVDVYIDLIMNGIYK